MMVGNGHQYLSPAIESILAQTFADFELLVISEHGSSDQSIATINQYSDARLRHIHNRRRLGLVGSLNLALGRARGDYVARMDSDDVSFPERLERQVKFLDGHPSVGVVGTGIAIIDEKGLVISKISAPSEPALTKWLLLFGNVIPSSAMMRRSLFHELGGYKAEALYVEDYDLWLRAAEITHIVNLREVLVGYRIRGGSVSRAHRELQRINSLAISHRALESVLGEVIPPSVLKALVQHSAARAADAVKAGMVLCDLCRSFTYEKRISQVEKNLIRADAARRLRTLALICSRLNLLSSIEIWSLITHLAPELFFPLVISTLHRAVKFSWQRLLETWV
jgi:glycosyltransferase involved in cell wall biosynthesis